MVVPKAMHRWATSCPMLPKPTSPTIFRKSSWPPAKRFFSQAPDLVAATAGTSCRCRASIMPMVSSATATELPPGVFITVTPVPGGRLDVDVVHPHPGAPMTFSFPGVSSTSAVTLVALRTASASYSPMMALRSAGFSPVLTSTVMPGVLRNVSRPSADSSSATSSFIVVALPFRRWPAHDRPIDGDGLLPPRSRPAEKFQTRRGPRLSRAGRLPEPEGGAGGVDDDAHLPHVGDRGDVEHHLRPEVLRLPGGRGDVGDVDVGQPLRRGAGRLAWPSFRRRCPRRRRSWCRSRSRASGVSSSFQSKSRA